MEIKSVLTIRWLEGNEERQYCEIMDFTETVEERRTSILNVLPVLALSDQYKRLLVDDVLDPSIVPNSFTLYHGDGDEPKPVGMAEFSTVLKQGNSYFELTPVRLYPTNEGWQSVSHGNYIHRQKGVKE